MQAARRTAPEPAIRSELTGAAASALAESGIQPLSLLHAGAFLCVFDALLADGRHAVVKLPRAAVADHLGAVHLVAREHARLAAIHHPHVVAPYALIRWPGGAALVLEKLPGGDLVPLGGRRPGCWLPAAAAVLAGLEAVHAQGHTHGDLKASNVLRTQDGRYKLIDLGSAAAFGAPLGGGGRTPAHEPAYFRFERADPAQDLHAFAVLVYELATGRLPFGPEPGAGAPRRPPVLGIGTGEPALRRLAEIVSATLAADCAGKIGTLIEFCDVIEFVDRHRAAANGGN